MSEKKVKAERKAVVKEIKLTNQELRLLMMSDGMQKLIDATNISPKLKFQTLLMVKKLRDILEPLEKVRSEILEKYAEKDEDGERVIRNDLVQFGKNKKEANEKLDELMEEETTILSGKIVINLSDKDFPKDLLSTRHMIALSTVVDFKGV